MWGRNMGKIDRFGLFMFDGEGYITDRLRGKKIVKFNFQGHNKELGEELAQMCLKYLNDLEKSDIDKVLEKYEIDSAEKLDLVLMQQRVW